MSSSFFFSREKCKGYTLVCPHCGHSIDLDDYGREGNEEYENLYPTREEVLGIANDDSEEDSDD